MTAATTRRSGRTAKGFDRVGTISFARRCAGVVFAAAVVLAAPAVGQDDDASDKVQIGRAHV